MFTWKDLKVNCAKKMPARCMQQKYHASSVVAPLRTASSGKDLPQTVGMESRCCRMDLWWRAGPRYCY